MSSFVTMICMHCSVVDNELKALRAKNARLVAQVERLEHFIQSAVKNQVVQKVVVEDNTSVTYSPFSNLELQRYGRQMLVKKFGVKAQLKLQIAKVLLIGVGGLGSPAAMYLAAMGVDTLAIVDDDHVDRSNLHRQILHDEQGAEERERKVHSREEKTA
ncbi:unnamed protein product [Peronospora belbahrii]|uniref:THIF-type NAD/FAD binding fold domain-containing protein n=1 Tax=Peronospora belbahrii TaxID=622444 RepID=A0ABN8CYZ4_9STRA|nr:unnamed protein product [Peronospora belbahrii]